LAVQEKVLGKEKRETLETTDFRGFFNWIVLGLDAEILVVDLNIG
jgi:hypothetical protein